MPARAGDLLRPQNVPHEPARLRNDLGEFLCARPPTDDRQRAAVETFETDLRCHARLRDPNQSRRAARA